MRPAASSAFDICKIRMIVDSSTVAGAGVFTLSLYNSRLRQLPPTESMLSTSADLELTRAAALLDTDAAEAARRARAILKSEPRHEVAALLLAAACRRLGESVSAIDVMEGLA